MAEESPTFLDVPRLLERSEPRPRPILAWYALTVFAVFVLTGTLAGSRDPKLRQTVSPIGAVAMLGVVAAMGFFTSHAVKRQREEQQRLEAVEELVQLRRWDQAAATLDEMLSKPTRSAGARVQALVYLCGVLARYHRFADVLAVQDYLLEHARFDPAATLSLKVMRAMAMLHEDHLFDADRAINDLRRESPDSAGLALVELYRDVKTGHPAEAVEVFHERLPALRDQLGTRVADAYALAARAHDLLGQEAEAAVAFERATLLAPTAELARRYPEVAPLVDKYPAATVPGQQPQQPQQGEAAS
jgi:tetratricopeptide (TPR) repeat protein